VPVDYYIRQGDHGVVIRSTLLASDQRPVDLAAASVRFQLASVNGGAALIDREADVEQVGAGDDGSKGQVSFTWDDGDTDTPGLFRATWEVAFSGGGVQTFPNDRDLLVRVTDDVN
jgi:hypothetical protein